MGCFLTMTDRDLRYLRSSLKTGLSVVGSAGAGQVKVEVSAVGYRSARQMAALIRNEARSARVATDDGRSAAPMKERMQYQMAEIASMGLLGSMGRTIDQLYRNEMIRAGKVEAEPIAASILQQSGYLEHIGKITRSKGVDIIGTSKAGQTVIVEVKLSGSSKDFGRRLKSGVYKDDDHPDGMRQGSDSWIQRTTPDVDVTTAHVLGVHIDPFKQTVSVCRRVDNEARVWKPLFEAKLSEFDLSEFE